MDLVELSNGNNYRHPWELSRRDCIISEIKKYHKNGNILDIGCGDLYFDNCLVKEVKLINELWGIDIYASKDRKKGICHWVNKYNKIKPKGFDTILMMDVLEHIEDDTNFLKGKVKPFLKDRDSKIILTVPAFQSLFSKHDEVLKHYRRYNIKNLKEVCRKSGLEISNYHYFFFSLLPLRLLTLKNESKASTWRFPENHIITRIVRIILTVDYKLCSKLGFLSLGLSLFAIIKRSD